MAQSQILATIGPFTGLDQKTPPRFLNPGKSVAESGLESYTFNGAFLPVIGRSLLFNHSTHGGGGLQKPIVGFLSFPLTATPGNYILLTGPQQTSSNGATVASWDGTNLHTLTNPLVSGGGSAPSPISLQVNSRMVQYQNYMFFSGLQTGLVGGSGNLPLWKCDNTLTLSEWQLQPPSGPAGSANVGVTQYWVIGGTVNVPNTIQLNLTSYDNNGNVVSTATDAALKYTTMAGDTPTTVAAALASAIQTRFAAIYGGTTVFATSSGANLQVNVPGGLTNTNFNILLTASVYMSQGWTQTGAGLTIQPDPTHPATLSGAYYYTFTDQGIGGVQESGPAVVNQPHVTPATGLVAGPVFYGSMPAPPAAQNNCTTGPVSTFAFVAMIPSSDPAVGNINLYRLGGSVGQWVFMSSIANPAVSVTPFLTDNIPDSALTGQALVPHRDPPAAFNDIFLHKDRIFGFGEFFLPNGQGNLWYSNYKEPWSFDNVNQVLPVGQNASGDVASAGVSVGSIAILLKSKSGYVLYGDSQVDFLVRPAFNVGCGAQFSLVQGEGVGYWLSNDKRVYSFDGNQLTYISGPIQPSLTSLTSAQVAVCVGGYYEQKYYLSIPALQLTYYYDVLHQEWHQLPWFTTCMEADPSIPEINAFNSTGVWEMDKWFTDPTDSTVAGGGFTPSYVSGIFTQPDDQVKQYRWVQVQAPATASSYPIVITLTTNPQTTGPYKRSYNVVMDLINGSQVAGLPNSLMGTELQVTVTGAPSANGQTPIIEKVIVRGWPRHAIRTKDLGV